MKNLELALNQGEILLKVISPIWKKLEFSHIWVSQYFYSGKYIDICTKPSWKIRMEEEKWYESCVSHLYQGLLKGNSLPSHITWSSNEYDQIEVFDSIKKIEKVQSGYNFFIEHEDRIESIGIGSQLSRVNLSKQLIEHKIEISEGIAALKIFTKNQLHLKNHHGQLNWKLEKKLHPFSLLSKTQKFPIILFGIEKSLTYRQIQILGFFAQGQTCKSIAEILNLSPRTIEVQSQKLRLKFEGKYQDLLIKEFHINGYFDLFRSLYTL